MRNDITSLLPTQNPQWTSRWIHRCETKQFPFLSALPYVVTRAELTCLHHNSFIQPSNSFITHTYCFREKLRANKHNSVSLSLFAFCLQGILVAVNGLFAGLKPYNRCLKLEQVTILILFISYWHYIVIAGYVHAVCFNSLMHFVRHLAGM